MNGEDLKILAIRAQTVTGRAERRLDEVHARIRSERRRRRSAVAGAMVAIVAIAIVAVASGQDQPAVVNPTGPSSSIPGGEVVKPHPFLRHRDTSWWHGVPRPGTNPPRLIDCVDPRTWGAVISQAATWVDPHPSAHNNQPGTRMNEFLMQYPDAPSAHQAFLHAARKFAHCPAVVVDPLPDFGFIPAHAPNWDEAFGGQTGTTPGPNPANVYVLLMARKGNVLLVEEDTGLTSDRGECRLSIATERALPHLGTSSCGPL
jgi:hypothetical protein